MGLKKKEATMQAAVAALEANQKLVKLIALDYVATWIAISVKAAASQKRVGNLTSTPSTQHQPTSLAMKCLDCSVEKLAQHANEELQIWMTKLGLVGSYAVVPDESHEINNPRLKIVSKDAQQ